MSTKKKQIRLGISCGDINGIGMEVILKSLQDSRITQDLTTILYTSPKIISYYKKALNLPEIPYTRINDANEAKPGKISVVSPWEEDVAITPGEENETGGKYAFLSLEAAVNDLASSKFDVLVTAPINKNNIQSSDFKFPGHTEYLAKFANAEDVLMFLVSDGLRVGVVTGHLPLKDVSKSLSKDNIFSKLKIMNQSLIRDFCINRPKIAVLGLNPHAGDNGLLGEEEKEIIIPAVKKANDEKILAFGPFAADGFFGSGAYKNYNAVLAMYHDQGLAPFKSLSFGEGVNYTAGLPIVRTSPDHGTAYDITGQNIASENSFRSAIYLAIDVYKNRQLHKEFSASPLLVNERARGEN
ncbi:MAG: 4-hydroxythreonine-4-phosphate dehydrogenase PdxA [Flavobacteriales bacterium]